ncbi:hypothetical protein ACVIGV_000071 [Rhizobium leguminosarum]
MARNHNTVIGPKSLETAAVPLDWTAKRTTMIAADASGTYSAKAGVINFRPSSADMTDKAGVIIASPMKRAAPIRPAKKSTGTFRPIFFTRRARSESAPPSPSLSALRRKSTYLKVTMIVSVQTISEIRPMTSVSCTPSAAKGLNASRKA